MFKCCFTLPLHQKYKMDNITTSNDAIFDFAPYIIVLCIILTVFIAVFDLLWKKKKDKQTSETSCQNDHYTIDNKDIHSYLKKVCLFLSRYASKLIQYGATTIRIEKNIGRIAERFDTVVEMGVLPQHIMVTLWDKEHLHSYSNNEIIKSQGVDFDKNTMLSKLSWEIHDNRMELDEAIKRFEDIIARPRLNDWTVLILTGLANGSFCRLFGGDFISMVIVFVATICGFYLKNSLHGKHGWDIRLVTIISGCIATIIASSCYVFGWGETPDIALGTGVLYLVPGVLFINSINDLINGHHICFISRFINATIITICLSLGLCLGLIILNIKFL